MSSKSIKQKCIVARIESETTDIKRFELIPCDGEVKKIEPGAHIDLFLANGLIRQYSFCNKPTTLDRYIIAVKRENNSRGGSAYMFEQVWVNDVLEVSEPRNNFRLASNNEPVFLIAGGIGVTPLFSMATALKDQKKDFLLHYFARTSHDVAFRETLMSPEWGDNVVFHFGVQPEDISQKLKGIFSEMNELGHFYVCGPPGLLQAVQTHSAPELPSERIHYEHFSGMLVNEATANSFEVYCSRSDRKILIPADISIGAALMQAGIDVEMMCEQGVCGTCRTTVIDGIPDHQDFFLPPAEKEKNDAIMICCSRSRSSTLVLDI
ncbi:PDR/VanB family oxidoreductase [Variovorax sp. GB1P17]|uniref:PDR/VanB family oxidoreductase n=1 Tax=Variovorax sp. GB1P17 TaxID=3443740 RepID=UPI003F46921B